MIDSKVYVCFSLVKIIVFLFGVVFSGFWELSSNIEQKELDQTEKIWKDFGNWKNMIKVYLNLKIVLNNKNMIRNGDFFQLSPLKLMELK